MRQKFIDWFKKVHPGMDVDGPTGHDEWNIWSVAYLSGMNRALEMIGGKPIDDFVDHVCEKVNQCESAKS